MALQEKERTVIEWVRTSSLMPLGNRRLLEIGCGSGTNLLQFLKLGFAPKNMVANELLEERAKMARLNLPRAIEVLEGDALSTDFGCESFDVVVQSTVFTSLLDQDFQKSLAQHLWNIVKPGGGVLWYDFIYDNPKNPDVRGVPICRIRELFPEGTIRTWHVTLAPPISRIVTKVHPRLYDLFNLFPFLRTHVLCWIQKSLHDR
jgi:SAM-dependent methyltransferase